MKVKLGTKAHYIFARLFPINVYLFHYFPFARNIYVYVIKSSKY